MNFRSCYNLKIQLFLAALVRFLHFGFKTVARSWMRIFPTDMFIMMCRLLSAAVKFAKALAMWIEDPDESAFWIQFICVKSAEILLKRIRFDSLVFAILPHVIWMVFFFFLLGIATGNMLNFSFLSHRKIGSSFSAFFPLMKSHSQQFSEYEFHLFFLIEFPIRPSSLYWKHIRKHTLVDTNTNRAHKL